MMRDTYINSILDQLTKSVPAAEAPSSKISSYETSQMTTKTVQVSMRIVVIVLL